MLEPRMCADGHGLILEAETKSIIGCGFEVLNGLVVEFALRGIPCDQQQRYDVVYKGVKVGEYVPDLIIHGAVVPDVKVIERITDHELGQMLNYLKITGLSVGVILNLRRARLEWKGVVNNVAA